jgi:phospholipase/carboxylesterase
MYEDGCLHVRPTRPKRRVAAGLHPIHLRSEGSGLLLIPAGAGHGPLPFAVMLHGAGARASHGLALLQDLADAEGIAILAPQSRARSWDFITGAYGPDVEAIDDLLAVAFARVEVDPKRLAIGGFSDGASYALSLGLQNGGLFTHVLAFSPGFAAPSTARVRPRIFIAHGREDEVLPLRQCSDRLVPTLRRAGCEVEYREFDGGHDVPHEIRVEASRWFKQSPVESSERARRGSALA